MSANVIDSIFISLGLDASEFSTMMQQVQKNIGSTLGVINDFSTGLSHGITETANDMGGLMEATEKAKKELEKAGKSGADGMGKIGKKADETTKKINKAESAAKSLGKKLGGSIKAFITNVATPLAGLFAVGSLTKGYFADLETLDAMSKKTSLSIGEQAEKQKLLSRYNKEDLGLYQDMKKSLAELGKVLQEAFRPIMKIIVPALSWFSHKLLDLVKFCKEHKSFFIPLIAGIAAVFTTTLIPAIDDFGTSALKSFTAAILPLLPLIVAVTLLALIIDDLWVFMKGGDSALERLMVKFGATQETIEETRTAIKNLFDAMKESFPFIFEFFGLFALGITTFKLTAVTLALLRGEFALTATAIKGMSLAFKTLTMAIRSNPIGAILSVLVVVITLIILHWDDLKKAGIAAWKLIKSAWSEASEWFGRVFEKIKATFQKFKDFIKDLLPPWLKDLLGIDGGKGITATITETKKALTDMASSFIPEGVANTFAEIGDAIKGLGSGATTMAAASSPELAISPSSISHTKSSNTSVTTNMGGVNIEVKSTDPVQAGAEVKNGLQAMVNTNNVGVKQK